MSRNATRPPKKIEHRPPNAHLPAASDDRNGGCAPASLLRLVDILARLDVREAARRSAKCPEDQHVG